MTAKNHCSPECATCMQEDPAMDMTSLMISQSIPCGGLLWWLSPSRVVAGPNVSLS